MIKKFCDRCGKDVTEGDPVFQQEIGMVDRAEVHTYSGLEILVESKDVCSSCYSSLQEWWKGS